MRGTCLLSTARSAILPVEDAPAGTSLVAGALREALVQEGVHPARLEELILAGESVDVARLAALDAGLSVDLPATPAAGGLEALRLAVMAVDSGWRDLVLAAALTARPAKAAPVLSPGLRWRFGFAEAERAFTHLARRHGITAEDLAAWNERWQAAGGGIRPVAAGVALLVGSMEQAATLRLPPRARIAGLATAGADPADPLRAVEIACSRVLRDLEMEPLEMDLVSIDDPSVVLPLAVARAIGLPLDRLNPDGGSLSRGHAGEAAAMLGLIDLLEALEERGGRFGLCCSSDLLGQATAVILDREAWE